MSFFIFIITCFYYGCTHFKPEIKNNSKNSVTRMNNYSGYSPFPNKNFVFLEKYTTLNENDEPCTSSNPADCTQVDDLIASASGAVIKKHGDTAYVLTAGHFCDNADEENVVPTIDDKEIVRAYSGVLQDFKFPMSVIKIDKINDLCLMKIKDPEIKRMWLERLKISKKSPNVGAKIYTVSAPLGIFCPNSRHHFTGYFSGCDDVFDYGLSFCFYTIPAAEGSSGSLVLNEKGEVVGMIQMALNGFQNLSLGTESEKINAFLKEIGSEINILF